MKGLVITDDATFTTQGEQLHLEEASIENPQPRRARMLLVRNGSQHRGSHHSSSQGRHGRSGEPCCSLSQMQLLEARQDAR
jgi:hypothetical protein